ncbi:hypothetical protein AB6A40_007347 [Gnathostoma spinigerum]|uniref:Acyl-CoA dehydrogenase n=1 Tax=Gnathostoma spinigerum TaxID=75299 RepID=A0ABD6EUB7_9BILA
MNRFEKDFVIYPEYSDTEDLRNIQGFSRLLKEDLSRALGDVSPSDEIAKTLERHRIPAAFISSDYGGLGMCNKDLLAISEILSIDWSVFLRTQQIHCAANIITLYGNEEQKRKLLPLIASGQIIPAICLYEGEMELDFDAMKTGVVTVSAGKEKLSGCKVNVIGASNANLFIVFGCRKLFQGGSTFTCFLVEKNASTEGNIVVSKKVDCLGLDFVDVSEVEFSDVPLSMENIIDSSSSGREIALEYLNSSPIIYGAAVTGFMKRLIEILVKFCNTTVQCNAQLSKKLSVQKLTTEMALSTFALESMCYYIGGMMDENLVVITDIENAIINRFANRVIREAIASTIEIVGLYSCDRRFDYEKLMRDVLTVLSIQNKDSELLEQISLGTLTAWSNVNARNMSKWQPGLRGTLNRMFGPEKFAADLSSPKLIHFIAEHAHPSLENACRNLEYNMFRLNSVLGVIVAEYGKKLENDFAALDHIANVVEGNLSMISIISRASRSYSIGLRNADLELAWTLMLCSRIATTSKNELESLNDCESPSF